MKVGDLVMKKTYGRTWDAGGLPIRVIARVIKGSEPRLHGLTPYYIALESDPGKWEDPTDYFIVSKA